MKEDFNEFVSQLADTNATLDYFTDFKKAAANTNKVAIKLNQLNYLIGKEDLRKAITELYEENPKTFDVLDILIAVRKKRKTITLNAKDEPVLLESYFTSLEGVIEYIEQTGLAEVFQNKSVTNLVDYVFGVEVGLDTNARKNRGGKKMANDVKSVFKSAGIKFRAEVNSTEFPEIKSLGFDKKRFDFVIKTKEKTYLIEVNFFNTFGSKPNEVARSYISISQRINQYGDFEFIWITDGKGWLRDQNILHESYSSISGMYNLKMLPAFIERIKAEQ